MAASSLPKVEIPELLREWLARAGEHDLEVLVMPGELVIRDPNQVDHEFDAWIEGYFRRRDSLMQRLADA